MTGTSPLGIGIIGCGNIFPAYARGLRRLPQISIVGCADVDHERALNAEATYDIHAFDTVDLLLRDPRIGAVVNITPPLFHAQVTRAILQAGKHVYTEKPMAAAFSDAAKLSEQAEAAGLTLGSAPDTFLGAAGQAARSVVDSGELGEIVGATAFVTHSKAELWHPDPTFLFREGGGPALDMGPYYLTALVNLLGPVRDVYSVSRIGASHRTVTAPGKLVDEIAVEIPTHAAATLTFASGALATVLMSFDVWDSGLPHIEIYGTRGTLSVPDPDQYDEEVRIRLHGDSDWRAVPAVTVPPTKGLTGDDLPLRGLGVADLADSLGGGSQRCSASLALHVLEVLEAIATGDGSRHAMTTSCDRPQPVPGI